MTVYIKGKSKAAINRDLISGNTVTGIEFKLGTVSTYQFHNLPEGTACKIFEKVIDGNPFAKSYGTKKGNKLV